MIDKYLISAAVHLPTWQWAEDQGVDVATVLEGTGLEERSVRDPNCVLTSAQNNRILHNLIALRDNQALGLETGQRSRLAGIGALGLMMLCAPTIRKAIEAGIEFAPIGGALGQLALHEEKGAFSIRFHPPATGALLRPYLTEDMFAAIYSYLAELCGTLLPGTGGSRVPMRAERITIGYPEPAYADQYRAFFQCPIEFGAPVSAMYLSPELLQREPALSNALAYDQCRGICERLVVDMREEAPLLREARQCLTRDPAKYSNLTALAAKLGVPPRTLQRHLARMGITFSVMLADVRSALAQDLLSNPALTVEEVATAIGYSEPGNFRRAFREWTGVTPSEYRRALRR